LKNFSKFACRNHLLGDAEFDVIERSYSEPYQAAEGDNHKPANSLIEKALNE
jgi:hypothetical protein